jgi:hypothetical protein
MQLPVVPSQQIDPVGPWFAGGLKFTCSQCGNCCTGGPGYVWVSPEEIVRLAEFLHITADQVVERYCRKVGDRLSFKEKRGPGGFDCVFLTEGKETAPSKGGVPLKRQGCSIYPVRPLQCRTWPFWPENLSEPGNWERAAQRCHGMNHGRRQFSLRQIESLRDAKDWPDNPPTSAPRAAKLENRNLKSEARD